MRYSFILINVYNGNFVAMFIEKKVINHIPNFFQSSPYSVIYVYQNIIINGAYLEKRQNQKMISFRKKN